MDLYSFAEEQASVMAINLSFALNIDFVNCLQLSVRKPISACSKQKMLPWQVSGDSDPLIVYFLNSNVGLFLVSEFDFLWRTFSILLAEMGSKAYLVMYKTENLAFANTTK